MDASVTPTLSSTKPGNSVTGTPRLPFLKEESDPLFTPELHVSALEKAMDELLWVVAREKRQTLSPSSMVC